MQVDACRREGVLLCAGDLVVGVQGGGMDELTALMLKSVKRGVDDPTCMPPVMRQLSQWQREQKAANRAGIYKSI